MKEILKTNFGDLAWLINPHGDLFKTEVYQLKLQIR